MVKMLWLTNLGCAGALPMAPTTGGVGQEGAPPPVAQAYSFSILIVEDGTENRMNFNDLHAVGDPDKLIRYTSETHHEMAGKLEDFRRNFATRDEFGTHTASEHGDGWTQDQARLA